MSNRADGASAKDDDASHDSGEEEFYDVDAERETTEYVSTTFDSSTTEESIKFKVEELPVNEDFKERFFEAQERLGELETELKNTRERLRNLEDACEHTEEKIGVLKNAAFSYHKSFSEHEVTFKTVLEENKELKIVIEKLRTTIRLNKEDREKTDEIKRTINEQLKEQLDAAAKENEELEKEVEELRAMNAKYLRDTKDIDKKKCKYCGRDNDDSSLTEELESLKLKFDATETEKDKLEDEKKELRSEIDDLKNKLKDMQIKLSADDEIIEEMKQQLLDYHVQIAESEEIGVLCTYRTTSIGKSINSYLQGTTELEDHAIHLLFSANRWEAVPKIKELIEKGTLVIMDRYAFSGVAFTAAKKGFDVKWCKNPDRGLPSPDVVFYLDISIKDAEMRGQFGEERYEKAEFQQRVADIYKQLRSDDWKVLDAMRDKNDIHMEIRSTILEMEELCRDAPLKDLWTNNS